MTAGRDVLAVRLGSRVTTKSESFLNYFAPGIELITEIVRWLEQTHEGLADFTE